jgi:hypothetical protein
MSNIYYDTIGMINNKKRFPAEMNRFSHSDEINIDDSIDCIIPMHQSITGRGSGRKSNVFGIYRNIGK